MAEQELTPEERDEAVRAGRAAYEMWRGMPNRDAYVGQYFTAAAETAARAAVGAVAARVRAQIVEDLRRTLAALNVAIFWARPDTDEGRQEIDGCRIALEMGQAALARVPAAGPTDQPRCPKCQTPLATCDCEQPAQCGELTCAACTPDQPQDRTEEKQDG